MTRTDSHDSWTRDMYGCDIDAFVERMENSITYKTSGSAMMIAGLMSDAQEQMHMDDAEGARQTLNRAKHLLFLTMSGRLKFNTLNVEKIEEV